MDYRDSGVDIDAGNETVRRIKSLAKATFTPGVLSDLQGIANRSRQVLLQLTLRPGRS